MWSYWNCVLCIWSVECYYYIRKDLIVFYKEKYIMNMLFSNFIFRLLFKGSKKIYLLKDFY